MKPWERYAEPADAGPWSKFKAEPSFLQSVGESARDVVAGAVRGAGSIGATILAPVDVAADALAGKGLTLESNRQRRAAMDAALQELGADPQSTSFAVGKLGAEIAGTLGAGGAAANVVRAAAPNAAAAAAPVLQAVETAGFRAGGLAGAQGLAARTAGGAITGGLSAGLVNPEDAGSGALIGGALPGAMSVAAKSGQAVAKVLRGPMQSPEVQAAVKAARDAGFVIPPSQAKPSLGNRVLEGVAGKITTAQNASAKNDPVIRRLAAKALNLPEDVVLSPDVLNAVRKTAGLAYEAVESTGTIVPSAAYAKALDTIVAPAKKAAAGFPDAAPSPVIRLIDSLRSDAFDAAAAVAKVRELRSAADDAFRAGTTDVGRAARAAAGAIEDEMERHLGSIGRQDLLRNLREARTLIAKTYTVEKAMNAANGSVDARKLAKELQKGKPLTGELRTIAEVGAQFPKAVQPVEAIGSMPQLSPLDFFGSTSLAALSGDPLALLTLGTRPLARAAALSGPVQNRLTSQPQAMGAMRVPLESLMPLGYRAAPVIGASDQ